MFCFIDRHAGGARHYCLLGSSSTLEKPKGGSSGGSPCGGPSCCLYSIRERGGGVSFV
jgi:hypothetical protein